MRAVLFLFVFCSFPAWGQTDFYEKYYPAIDRAEQAFIRDEFTEAIRHYTEAFKAVEKPLARDIYNGVVCYYLSGNIDGAKPWLLLLARKGIDPAVLEGQEAFKASNIQAEWKTFRPVYQQIYDTFSPDKDEATDQLIRTIQEQMEEIRKIHNGLPDIYYEMDSLTVLTPGDSAAISLGESKMKAIYDAVSTAAADHIMRYGLPSEDRYGIVSEDLTMDALRSFLSNINFYSLLPGTSPEMLRPLNEKLLEEVGKGNVHRDYVLETVDAGKLSFVRLVIPDELSCAVKGDAVFVKPRTKGPDDSFELLAGENEEMQIAKGYYAIFRNEYFLIHEQATYEDVVAENCEHIMKLGQELIRVEQ